MQLKGRKECERERDWVNDEKGIKREEWKEKEEGKKSFWKGGREWNKKEEEERRWRVQTARFVSLFLVSSGTCYITSFLRTELKVTEKAVEAPWCSLKTNQRGKNCQKHLTEMSSSNAFVFSCSRSILTVELSVERLQLQDIRQSQIRDVIGHKSPVWESNTCRHFDFTIAEISFGWYWVRWKPVS